jgi:hypothetical protein
MNYYVELGLAILAGDKDEAKLLRDSKKAENALKSQISIREGKRFELEESIDASKEALKRKEVTFPESGSAAETYVKNLVEAKNEVTKAEKTLVEFDKVTNYLKETLEKITSETKKK